MVPEGSQCAYQRILSITITAKVEPLRCTARYHGAARHGTALGHSQQTESSAVSLRLQCCKICNVAF